MSNTHVSDSDCNYCWTLMGLIGRHKDGHHNNLEEWQHINTVEELCAAIKTDLIRRSREGGGKS